MAIFNPRAHRQRKLQSLDRLAPSRLVGQQIRAQLAPAAQPAALHALQPVPRHLLHENPLISLRKLAAEQHVEVLEAAAAEQARDAEQAKAEQQAAAARQSDAARRTARAVGRLGHRRLARGFASLARHRHTHRHRSTRAEAGAHRLRHVGWRWSHTAASRAFSALRTHSLSMGAATQDHYVRRRAVRRVIKLLRRRT